MKDQIIQLATSMIGKVDDLIKEAITKEIGEGWTLEDVKLRGIIGKMPDGSQVFSFDGKPLLQFYDIEVEMKYKGFNTYIVGTQQYKQL